MKNRTVDCIRPHPQRDRFYRELGQFGFNKAAKNALENKYDIGLVGNWSYPNYGSELTYYALYWTLKSMGYSVLMIEWAQDSRWKPYGSTQLFEWEPYENSEIAHPVRNHAEFYGFNQICRMFVQGSDQLLQPDLYEAFGKIAVLDWVDVDQKKIGYALSFGHETIEYSEVEQNSIDFHLDKFDGISVREDTAVTIMKEKFNIQAKWVLDPVFLCKKSVYEKLAEPYIQKNGKTLFAYILDPTEEKIRTVKKIALDRRLDLRIVSDAAQDNVPESRYNMKFLDKIPVEKWLAEIMNSELVITDSYHGTCLSVILRKNFIVMGNEMRGATRFLSVLKPLGLESRLVWNVSEILDPGLWREKIDYNRVNRILNKNRAESMEWLSEQLKQEHKMRYSQEYLIWNERYREMEKILFDKMNCRI